MLGIVINMSIDIRSSVFSLHWQHSVVEVDLTVIIVKIEQGQSMRIRSSIYLDESHGSDPLKM